MEIKAEEISRIIRKQIEDFDQKVAVMETGSADQDAGNPRLTTRRASTGVEEQEFEETALDAPDLGHRSETGPSLGR